MDITTRARRAIAESQTIIGYRKYIDSVAELLVDKQVLNYGMKQEKDRCEKAIELAVEGHQVALLSSGDAGIYGMAGLALELASRNFEVEVIPGITAASWAASLLGAPLMNDFATVSLSDLLTPWEIIEKRLEHAARGGFAIALYNPGSKGRRDHLSKAVKIIAAHAGEELAAGIVEKHSDDEYSVRILKLNELIDLEANMHQTIIIGSRKTFIKDAKLITSRGYPT